MILQFSKTQFFVINWLVILFFFLKWSQKELDMLKE